MRIGEQLRCPARVPADVWRNGPHGPEKHSEEHRCSLLTGHAGDHAVQVAKEDHPWRPSA